MKAILVVLICFLGMSVLNGCATISKSAQGMAEGARQGAKEDWKALEKADKWMQENMW